QRAGLTLTVDPVSQIVGASVVVDDGAGDLRPGCFRPDENPVIGRVMNDQVDELDSRPSEVDAVKDVLLWSGVRDLEAPKPCVRTSHEEDVGNRRTLTGILAHYDRSVSRTRQCTREAPWV